MLKEIIRLLKKADKSEMDIVYRFVTRYLGKEKRDETYGL